MIKRFPLAFVTGLLIAPIGGALAQTAPTGSLDVAALRAEVAQLKGEADVARRVMYQARDLLTQVQAQQTALNEQIANLAKTQVAKDEILKHAQLQIGALNTEIQRARVELGAISRRAQDTDTMVRSNLNGPLIGISSSGSLPLPTPVPSVEPIVVGNAGPAVEVAPAANAPLVPGVDAVAALDHQCSRLRSGDGQVWRAAITQILPGHAFEEVDLPNGRVWATSNGSSQGFVYTDVMKQLGCKVT